MERAISCAKKDLVAPSVIFVCLSIGRVGEEPFNALRRFPFRPLFIAGVASSGIRIEAVMWTDRKKCKFHGQETFDDVIFFCRVESSTPNLSITQNIRRRNARWHLFGNPAALISKAE
ncbi:unnamed protein product [Caenorhabditis auriculariae]|uniref:Uncharacterized protein n=1 Tax=Caenorhabditis auriculariae TaxID=2777116 RepID=A0A8S1GYN0_9PELO|nr:unnamed protein product [Caenorhabditis auriculariae]